MFMTFLNFIWQFSGKNLGPDSGSLLIVVVWKIKPILTIVYKDIFKTGGGGEGDPAPSSIFESWIRMDTILLCSILQYSQHRGLYKLKIWDKKPTCSIISSVILHKAIVPSRDPVTRNWSSEEKNCEAIALSRRGHQM